jgi:hypothetical protein
MRTPEKNDPCQCSVLITSEYVKLYWSERRKRIMKALKALFKTEK